MRQCLAAARVGHLATVTAEARPHLVPCCFVLDGDTVYSAVDDVKPKSSLALRRLANLEAHPVASLLVDHYDDEWADLWWIRVDGPTRVLDVGSDHDTALTALAAKYAQYADHPPPGPVIAIDVARWTSWP
jgi:PPOX class probable F420-dependent enzyme